MHASSDSLLLVGCGRMGGALLAMWQAEGCDIAVIEPGRPAPPAANAYPALATLPEDFSPAVVVFAVKPQSLESVLPEYAERFGDAPLYVSIAAGKDLAFYARHLGPDARVIRAMPNTPALVGRGMTALCANACVTDADREIASALFAAVGQVAEVPEAAMHAVTALSGSGPAYAFLFMEALAEAGARLGLDASLARHLAMQTVAGATALAAKDTRDLASLRRDVTSPGGTTEAALSVLMENGALTALMGRAMTAADARSKELAKEG